MNTRKYFTHLLLAYALVSLFGCASDSADQHNLGKAENAYQKQNYGQTAALLTPLATNGDAEAQYALGYLYYYGKGVEQSQAIANNWFRRAAKQGHAKAQQALSTLVKHSGLNFNASNLAQPAPTLDHQAQ